MILQNANTHAQVAEHFGVGTWEQGLKIEVEKEMRKGSGPWGSGALDHGSWV